MTLEYLLLKRYCHEWYGETFSFDKFLDPMLTAVSRYKKVSHEPWIALEAARNIIMECSVVAFEKIVHSMRRQFHVINF